MNLEDSAKNDWEIVKVYKDKDPCSVFENNMRHVLTKGNAVFLMPTYCRKDSSHDVDKAQVLGIYSSMRFVGNTASLEYREPMP